jgi:hypothetical protein
MLEQPEPVRLSEFKELLSTLMPTIVWTELEYGDGFVLARNDPFLTYESMEGVAVHFHGVSAIKDLCEEVASALSAVVLEV